MSTSRVKPQFKSNEYEHMFLLLQINYLKRLCCMIKISKLLVCITPTKHKKANRLFTKSLSIVCWYNIMYDGCYDILNVHYLRSRKHLSR